MISGFFVASVMKPWLVWISLKSSKLEQRWLPTRVPSGLRVSSKLDRGLVEITGNMPVERKQKDLCESVSILIYNNVHIQKMQLFVLLTIHVRHVDSQFDEVGEVRVIWACVADLSRERLSSYSACNTRLAHTCNDSKRKSIGCISLF